MRQSGSGGYTPVANSYPATTGQHPVQAGDTLQSSAQAAYGDSSMWYLIADANGIQDNSGLRVGQILNIPTKVGATHNNSSTYRILAAPDDMRPTRARGACRMAR